MLEKRHPSGKKNFQAVAVGGLLILLVGGWFIFRAFWNNDSEENMTQKEATANPEEEATAATITADVIRQKLLNGEKIQFLDIRDQRSFTLEHIPHSRSLTVEELRSLTPENNDLLIVIFFESDVQTKEIVKNIIKQKPYPIFLLKGGFEEWRSQGNQTISPGNPESFLDQSKITYLSPSEALAMINNQDANPFILDVQSKQDYQKVHIKGAVNIPLEELEKRSAEIPSARNIIVYGNSEVTSFQGGVRLADLNFFSTRTLSGANILQKESGLPLEEQEQ